MVATRCLPFCAREACAPAYRLVAARAPAYRLVAARAPAYRLVAARAPAYRLVAARACALKGDATCIKFMVNDNNKILTDYVVLSSLGLR